ncbi:Neutrophil cytosol factor 2 p67phox [Corchorus capsularis]|uniref:Neutrophil cytosol factor 2 p67phox n=1 Tax=Corchorus capsularis TaxID=210143 RepID=A0A1R3JGI5_COCAP|nr:Neutrophil cytosol factor 2 p67phox [Corchorus capsularis]
MVGGAPLEDARHLAQRYCRMRQEAEAQAAEISRRQARIREAPLPENVAKLHAAEARMQELKQNMAVLGKEASAASAAVEAQQQRLSLQRLLAMMVSEKQHRESAPAVIVPENGTEKTKYYLAEAMHPFVAASEEELSLAVGDFVVVRKVCPSGWPEGECKGKAGWFPSAYVEKRQRFPSNNGYSSYNQGLSIHYSGKRVSFFAFSKYNMFHYRKDVHIML